MKIIDKTPLLDENGELTVVQRIKGMFQYGFSWPNELRGQKAIITFFDRQLEKGYTLIRNLPLGQSGIMVPMILLGPTGIHVIQVTFLRGRYEVRGDTWNVEAGEKFKPAPVNLVQQTMRMAHAVQVYIERQGVKLPASPEPVLIAAEPGLHIESVRPAVRVMMIDGIKSFVTGLTTTHAIILSPEQVFDYTERLLNPRVPKKVSVSPNTAPAQGSAPQEVSRARAIFNASEEARPFDAADFDFAMTDEEQSIEVGSGTLSQADLAGPSQPSARAPRASNKILGMTPAQLAILIALGLALLCILAGFAYIISTTS